MRQFVKFEQPLMMICIYCKWEGFVLPSYSQSFICVIVFSMSKSLAVSRNEPDLMLNKLELGDAGTIVVMVCRMWDVSSPVGRYLSTDFIVSDKEGYVMHCTTKANVAHNFVMLKEGGIYSVKNFAVVPNKKEFRIMRFADLMLEFDGDTTVRRSSMKSEGFNRYPFQTVEFDDLEATNNQYLIDVVGYVTNVGRITQQRTGSRTLDFYLANDRGQQIRVTLWGAMGEHLIENRTRHVGLYPIVITAVSVKLYNNRLYLSSTSSSMIIDNEKIPLLRRLKTDSSGATLTKEILPSDNSQAKPGSLENVLMWSRNRKYDTATFHCEVTIDRIRTKKGWNFPSCGNEKCKKGNIGRKHNHFWCDSCDSVVEYPVLRYRLELEVSDETAEVVVIMFDEPAISLLKCSAASMVASQMQDNGEHSILPVGLANIVGTKHVLELKTQSYFEHGNYESFTCWNIVTDDAAEGASSPARTDSKTLIEAVEKESPAFPSPSKPKEPEGHGKPSHNMEESSNSTKADSKGHRVSRLRKGPSVTTPIKIQEPKKRGGDELEDSDAEMSYVAESHPNEKGVGSSSREKIRRRIILDDEGDEE